MIRAEELTFQYPTVDEPSLHDVSLGVDQGDVLGIIGATESGKTTLSMVLAGLAPSVSGGWREGTLDVAGNDPAHEYGSDVGLVFEDYSSQLTQVRVLDEVLAPLLSRGFDRAEATDRARSLLGAVRLEGYGERRTWELSGGEQQRVAIAAILALDPEVIVFDTAIDMLDPKGQTMVSELIASLAGETTLVVTVDDPQHLVGVADRVVVLDDGRVVADGDADSVLRSASLFRECGIAPPTCVDLADELGLDATPLTSDEFVTAVEDSRLAVPGEARRRMQDGAFSEEIVTVEDLAFSYDDEARALSDVHLTVHGGEVHAIIGGNGAGKTTLSKLLCGLLEPDEGTVEVSGRSTADVTPRALGEHVGLAFQNPDAQISKRTVEQEVRFPLENRQYERSRWLGRRVNRRYDDAHVAERTAAALELTGLNEDGVADADPTTLGMGERRLTAIASALGPRPEAVILDEPTAGLDRAGERRMADIVEALASDGRAVVVIEHDMDFVSSIADRVTVLSEGRVETTGTPRDVFAPANWDWLRSHYLMPPRYARLADRLGVSAVSRAGLLESLRNADGGVRA